MSRLIRAIALVALGAVAIGAAAGVGDGLRLRAGEAAPSGTILTVDQQGVRIAVTVPTSGNTKAAAPASYEMTIAWDRVAALPPEWNEQWGAFRSIADKAWRARTRLERGDFVLAEPLLEELYETYRESSGPTSTGIANSLLACRLRRGARTAAVAPWLSVLRDGAARSPGAAASSSSPQVISFSGFGIDPTSGLAPELPPFWIPGASLRALVEGAVKLPAMNTSESAPASERRAGVLRDLYLAAAEFDLRVQSSRPVAPALPGPVAGEDSWTSLVRTIVSARVGDVNLRKSAREDLRKLLSKPMEPWAEAWCRVALGRSLVLESSHEDRRIGVVEMLYVPARMKNVSRYLTGLALAESAVALHDLGDTAGAAALRTELLTFDGSHPALEWDRLNGWGVDKSPSQPSEATPPATPAAPPGGSSR